MRKWWNELSPFGRVLLAVGTIWVVMAIKDFNRSDSGNAYTASSPGQSEYVDPKYRSLAEERGFKGNDADEVAKGAKSICVAGGGSDC